MTKVKQNFLSLGLILKHSGSQYYYNKHISIMYFHWP